jgi:hypothetical protein
MTDKENPSPPLVERRRVLNRRCFSGNYGDTHNTKAHRPQLITVTIVDIFIGGKHIVLRATRSIWDPDILNVEFRPYKSGPRKGQHRRVRVRGACLDRRVSIRRFSNATSAAQAYHATRRALGVGLFPWGRTSETSFALMGPAQLTDSGARSMVGRKFADDMRNLGVRVASEPTDARYSDEFWWADR